MKHTSLRLVAALAVLPMLLAAGVVSTAADEARRTSNAEGSRVAATTQELDAAAATVLAAKADAQSVSPSVTAPTSTGPAHPQTSRAAAPTKPKAPATTPRGS